MTWPGAATFDKTKLDAGTDDPAVSRAELYKLMQDMENVINGRAQASGVASLDSGSLVPIAQVPRRGMKCFTTITVGAGTWTVPTGVYEIFCWAVGGGGGGGYSASGDHGGGGGGGGIAGKWYSVAPGSDVDYSVGAGGAGGNNSGDNDGVDGGDTTVTPDAQTTITGGGGGGGVGGGTRFGGAGGTATNGDINLDGGTAASGETRGGMGGSTMFAGATAGGGNGYGGGGFGSGGAGGPGATARAGGVIIWY